jgi:hypothetical protein
VLCFHNGDFGKGRGGEVAGYFKTKEEALEHSRLTSFSCDLAMVEKWSGECWHATLSPLRPRAINEAQHF